MMIGVSCGRGEGVLRRGTDIEGDDAGEGNDNGDGDGDRRWCCCWTGDTSPSTTSRSMFENSSPSSTRTSLGIRRWLLSSER